MHLCIFRKSVSHKFGFGAIDAERLINASLEWENVEAHTSFSVPIVRSQKSFAATGTLLDSIEVLDSGKGTIAGAIPSELPRTHHPESQHQIPGQRRFGSLAHLP